MAISVPARRLTLDEFLALPEAEPPLELEPDGTVAEKVSPKGRHSTLQYTLTAHINRFAQPVRLAFAFPELRVTFGGVSRIPDVAVYRWDRVPRTPDGRVADDFLTPPDMAVEIVSPDQRVTALIRRCLWYVANGVRIALLVDPHDESVLLFRAGADMVVLRGADAIDLTDVLPRFTHTVGELFNALTLD